MVYLLLSLDFCIFVWNLFYVLKSFCGEFIWLVCQRVSISVEDAFEKKILSFITTIMHWKGLMCIQVNNYSITLTIFWCYHRVDEWSSNMLYSSTAKRKSQKTQNAPNKKCNYYTPNSFFIIYSRGLCAMSRAF